MAQKGIDSELLISLPERLAGATGGRRKGGSACVEFVEELDSLTGAVALYILQPLVFLLLGQKIDCVMGRRLMAGGEVYRPSSPSSGPELRSK
jgi:hypothetical protein